MSNGANASPPIDETETDVTGCLVDCPDKLFPVTFELIFALTPELGVVAAFVSKAFR